MCSPQKSATSVKEIPSSSVSISVRDFRVVCDNMLQGLGRYLRCLGVDVRMLENDDDHRKAAKVSPQLADEITWGLIWSGVCGTRIHCLLSEAQFVGKGCSYLELRENTLCTFKLLFFLLHISQGKCDSAQCFQWGGCHGFRSCSVMLMGNLGVISFFKNGIGGLV